MAVVKRVSRDPATSFSSKEDDAKANKQRALKERNAEALAAASESPVVLPGQVEFEQSESIDKLARSLVAFRAACPNIDKDKAGYGYKYATLGNVINKTRDPLKKNGLAVTQFPIAGHNALGVITLLIHESGQWIRARFLMPVPELTSTNVTQNAGAAITYARRYALGAVLGASTDEDTDAAYQEPDPDRPRPVRRRRG